MCYGGGGGAGEKGDTASTASLGLWSEHLAALTGRQRAPQPPRTALRKGHLKPLSGDVHSGRALERGCRSRGLAGRRTLVPNASAVGSSHHHGFPGSTPKTEIFAETSQEFQLQTSLDCTEF